MFTSGHVVCSVPQGLSLWFRANFQIQVLIRRRDTVWQIWGINWGLTTSHYVRRYWWKFRLVPLIKGKNNTAYEADDSKERLDGGLNDFGWVTVVHEGCCSLQKHGADGQPYQGLGEWRTWSEPTSLRWMWRVVGGPSDLLLTAVRRWPLPCHEKVFIADKGWGRESKDQKLPKHCNLRYEKIVNEACWNMGCRESFHIRSFLF